MLVLEAMAKDLYPDISILKCAVPYFKYAEKHEDNANFNERDLI